MNNSQNPHMPEPLPLTGIVTAMVFTISGAQTTALEVTGVGTEYARLTMSWGKLTMSFTTCEQVQLLRGCFALARQGMLQAPVLATLPVAEANPLAEASVVAVTWTGRPSAAASIEQAHNPRTRKTSNYVALTIGNLTFRILDRTALESVLGHFAHAHKLAVLAFPDGEDHKANPTSARWHPREEVRINRAGTGSGIWLPRMR